MPVYDYDRFGYCVLCSAQVAEEKDIDGHNTWILLPNHAEDEVLMSDGSKMRICVCTDCLPKVADNLPLIMQKVYAGWLHTIQDWPEEKKQNYINKYSQLSIVGVV